MPNLSPIFSDPFEEASHLVKTGNSSKALQVLQPLLQEILDSGNTPSQELKTLLEKIIINDASLHGMTNA